MVITDETLNYYNLCQTGQRGHESTSGQGRPHIRLCLGYH